MSFVAGHAEVNTLGQASRARRLGSSALGLVLASGIALGGAQTALAEGSFQMGLTQELDDIATTDTEKFIRVDILNAGEVINLAAGGGQNNAPNTNHNIQFTIFDSNLVQQAQFTTSGAVGTTGKISPTSAMDAPITNAYKFTAPSAGTYYVSMDNLNGGLLHRYDVTVTPNTSINPDPTGQSGITGRVSSENWQFLAGSFDEEDATDADYYILTPGGFPNTNYVWKLDLNNFAGYGYTLVANNRGVDAPNSGFSTERAGNSVQQDYPLYINRPAIAANEPAQAPTALNFTFTDSEGNDNSISPGGTVGVEDSGQFSFTTNASNATYAIYIDVNGDGIYGNPGDPGAATAAGRLDDIQLNGAANQGFNSVPFDGLQNDGTTPLPDGSYNAQLGVRLGEFHFVASDAETSGGPLEDGLTVYRSTTSGDQPTLVYWDDVSLLGNGPENTSTVPEGRLSGTPGSFHTWGDFQSGGFGNERFIDTYVYGETTYATYDVVITPADNSTTAIVDITDTLVPGDTLALSVTDMDQNTDDGVVETITASVINDVTGETETVTLTETGPDTGVFTSTLPTVFGTASNGNDTGTLAVQATDTVTLSYNDPINALGDPETRTDTGDVTGGADGTVSITPTSEPGDTLSIQVSDADLAGQGTLDVQVVNDVTGETETITLTESAPAPGTFVGSLPTAFGTTSGANGDGSLNTQSGDTVTVTYNDTFTAAGGTASATATDTVTGGATGVVTITPSSTPGDTLAISVTDADLSGQGTLTVQATNPQTGETETVTLTESATTPGLFEGSVATTFGAAAGTNNDGTFNTDSGDTIVVTYNDALTAEGGTATPEATSTVNGGATGTVDITDTSTPGDTLTVTVVDADLAGNGPISVTVTNPATGEIETVSLTETGTAGEFTGTVATVFGTAAGTNNDGTFNTQDGDTLVVTYDDALTADGDTASPTDTGTVAGGVDGAPTITAASTPGDTLDLAVADADLAGAGSVDVVVTNLDTGEAETVTLLETGTPGEFSGTISTAFGTAAGSAGDNSLNTSDGDTVQIAYADALTEAGGTATPTATGAVNGGATGTVAITPASTPGDDLAVTVVDADLAGTGTLTVSATNTETGETETLTLTESATQPGEFSATVPTTFGTTAGAGGDGAFNTQSGDSIVVTYQDALTTEGGTAAPTATNTVGGGADGAVTLTPSIQPGDPVTVSLSDADLADDGTVDVTVLNDVTGESETITLSESASQPGTFEAVLPTTFGTAAGTDNDGTMAVQNGDTLSVTYDDALTATGGTAQDSAQTSVTGGADATLTLTPTSTPGDTLTVRLEDADLSGTPFVDLQLTNPATGEVETVRVSETTPGVFEGTVATVFGTSAGTDNDGTFNTQSGDTVVAEYLDARTTAGGTQTLSATDTVGGGVTGTVDITDSFTPGDTLDVSVTDADLAGNGPLVVSVVNDVTGETADITLSETSLGVFEGTVATAFGTSAGAAGDGTLNAQASDTLTVTYNDALTTEGGTASPADTSSAQGGADGTVSIDPASTPGDTVAITVVDADLAGTGTLDVTVVNTDTGESETITLAETAPGEFGGTVDTAFGTGAGTAGDGTLNTQNGDTLTVTYNDALTAAGGTASPSANNAVGGGADGTVSITPSAVPGDPLAVTIEDADLAGTGTLVVNATNPSTGESESVTLTETSPGVFEGSVDTVFGQAAGTDNDGTFNADNGDTVVVTYTDALTAAGGTAQPNATAAIGGGADGTVAIDPAFIPGDAVAVSVEDADLAGAGTLDVAVVNDVTGEVETLTLTETTPGVFEGTVATVFGTNAGTDNDGTFNAQSGDTLTVTYQDALTQAGGTASPQASSTAGGGADGSVSITPASTPGDTLAVSVEDADLAGTGTLVVTATNPSTGESEAITLTETTPGVFEGSVDTAFGQAAGTNDDGTFNTQSGDTVVVAYNDALTAAGGTASQLATDTVGGGVDGTVSATPSFNPGDSVAFTVEDADLAGTGTLDVSVVNAATGETEVVTLTETTPGTFEGSVATVFGDTAGTDSDGTFNAQTGDVLTVTYQDALTAAGGTASPTDNSSTVGGDDGVVSITPSATPGDTLDVRVTDADLAGTGTLVVNATNPSTGETEALTLSETSPGVFEGTVATAFGDTAGTNDDGVFNTQSGDTITVTYDDALTSTGGTAQPDASSAVGGGADGALSSDPSATPGDTVAIAVTDADLAGTGTLDVAVVNDATGELETITLTETAPGVFEGTVDTVFGDTAGTDGDGVFNVQNGDTLTVSYDDALTANGSTASLTSVTTIGGGVDGTVSITPSAVPGEPLAVTVEDADLAGTGTLVVNATNPSTGESESVTLTETSPGVFEGSVDTVFGQAAGTDNDGTFNADNGDTVVVTYTDALTAAGGTAQPNATAAIGGGADGTVSVTPSAVPGDVLTVSVEDADLAGQGTITVSVVNDVSGEVETLTLTETTPGVFTADLPTQFGTSGTNDDGTLSVQSGDTLTVTYDDALTAVGGTASPAANASISGGSDAVVTLTPAIVPGDVLVARVEDADANTDASVAETLSVSVTNTDTGEVETLTLVETGPDTGVFELPLDTALSDGTDDNGTLGTNAGDVLELRYEDTLTAAGATQTLTANSDVLGMSVTKTAELNNGGDGSADAGDTITYRFAVTNTGGVALSDVSIADALVAVDGTLATLAPGATDSTTFSATYTLTQDDVNSGRVTNTATASAQGPNGESVGAVSDDPTNPTDADPDGDGYPSDPTVTTLGGAPSMLLEKTATLDLGADGVLGAGDTVAYDFRVVNTGNVTLTDIGVSDAMVAVQGGPLATLEPGAEDSTTFSAVYTLTQADIDAGGVTNTATATGTTPSGDPVTSVSDDPANPDDVDPDGDGNPSDPTVTTLAPDASMALLKVAVLDDGGDGFADIGDTITYNFTVTNTGNVSLSDLTIEDALVAVDGTLATLAPGASDSTTFSATYTLSADDLESGSVTNTATVTGNSPSGDPVTGVSDDPTDPTDADPDGDGNPSDPTVTPLRVDYAPVAVADSTATQMGVAVAIPVLANDSDADGDALAIDAVTQPDNGSVTFTPEGTLVYTPADGFVGTDSFTYTVCDPEGRCATADVTVTVDNDTPVATADSAGTEPGTPVTVAVLLNDTDPNDDDLRVTDVVQPASGTVVINPDGTLTYTPEPGFEGVDTFTYTACDFEGNCDTASVSVNVSADTPQAADDVASTPSETPLTIRPLINDEDPNGDPLSVTSVSQPANGTVEIAPDGTLTYTPNDDFVGTDVFTYTVCDADGNCDTATVTLNIENQAPVGGPDTGSTGEGEPITLAVLDNDTDVESTPLTVTAWSPPANGTVVVNDNGTLTYTPNDGFIGTEDFTYTVCDANLECVDVPVSIEVTPELPTLVADTGQTEPGLPVTVAVLLNDTDPNDDVLTVTDVTQPVGGTVTINPDGTLTVLPEADFEGELVVTYTACDTDGNCDTADLVVGVEAVSPVAQPDSVETAADTPVTLDPRLNDTDPNGDALTVTSVSLPNGGGAAVINPDGTVTITPEPGFVGHLVIAYEVCDADGNCDTANVVVSVAPPRAAINGRVFLDLNGDDSIQPGEPLQEGWIVEVKDADGTIVATVRTDADGFYEVTDLDVGTYDVVFRNPDTNTVYGMLDGVELAGGTTTIDQNLAIDPSGIVYDAVTRQPVSGAVMTLVDASGTPLPEVCLVDASQQGQETDTDGFYRFDVVPGADPACPEGETEYRIAYDAPDAYSDAASTLIDAEREALNPPPGVGSFQVVPQATAPAAGQDTTHYLTFVLGAGDRDVVNNHIPLDPAGLVRSPLTVTKTTPRRDVSFGDLVPYTITVTNTEDMPFVNLDLVDLTPPGFRYVDGSARLDGVATDPELDGREVIFADRDLEANETVTIDMVLVVGAGVGEGRFVNQAFARSSLDGSLRSGIAEATVQIVPSPLFDCSEVIGKVFDDANGNGYQDQGEDGMAGVRLVTAKGLVITTDQHGRYHVTCAAVPNATIGSNFILKLDERSLPTGYRMTTENPRVVRLTRGKMSKANFGTAVQRVVTLDLADDAFVPGETRMRLPMADNIAQLVSVLKQERSTLRVNYHDYEGLGPLAADRLEAVEGLLHRTWEQEGCCYELAIERKLLSLGPTATRYGTAGE